MNVSIATAIAVYYRSMVDLFTWNSQWGWVAPSFLTTSYDIELTCCSGQVIILPQDIASFVTSLPQPAQHMRHLAAAHASKYACLLTNLLPIVLLSWKYGGSSIVCLFTLLPHCTANRCMQSKKFIARP